MHKKHHADYEEGTALILLITSDIEQDLMVVVAYSSAQLNRSLSIFRLLFFWLRRPYDLRFE